MRVVWWRVGLLAAVTLLAGVGSWAAFTTKPTPPAARASPSPAGDVSPLFEEFLIEVSPTPSLAPPPPEALTTPSQPSRGSTGSRPRATRRPANPLQKIPGAGPIEDLCSGGNCR